MKKIIFLFVFLFAAALLSSCNHSDNVTSPQSVITDKAQTGGGEVDICSCNLNFQTYIPPSTAVENATVQIYQGTTYIMTVGVTNSNGYTWITPSSLSRGDYTAYAYTPFSIGSAEFYHDGESGQIVPIAMTGFEK